MEPQYKKPRYTHDGCPKCRFVCRISSTDVWICERSDSLIAREGDRSDQYISVPREDFRRMWRNADYRKSVSGQPFHQVWAKLLDEPKWVAHK